MVYEIAVGYLLVMTLLGFVLCGADKSRARRKRRRISERVLFLAAAVGGSVGFWVGMYIFRHKTRHKAFVLGIPGIILAQIGLAAAVRYLI